MAKRKSEERKRFFFYIDYFENMEDLSDADVRGLLGAMVAVAQGREPENLSGEAKGMFRFIRGQMERDMDNYDLLCETNRANGKKGGRPRKDAETLEPEEPEKNRTVISEPGKPDTETDTDADTETDADAETETETKETARAGAHDGLGLESVWSQSQSAAEKSAICLAEQAGLPDWLASDDQDLPAPPPEDAHETRDWMADDYWDEPETGKPPVRSGGQRPTFVEVQTLCRETESPVDPKRFFEYYEAKGWRMNGEPIRDWRAALRAWAQFERKPVRVKKTTSYDAEAYDRLGLELPPF